MTINLEFVKSKLVDIKLKLKNEKGQEEKGRGVFIECRQEFVLDVWKPVAVSRSVFEKSSIRIICPKTNEKNCRGRTRTKL